VIADQHHAPRREAMLEFHDLARQRGGIADMAFEYLDRDRTTCGCA
jgi:hypothetical protein